MENKIRFLRRGILAFWSLMTMAVTIICLLDGFGSL